MSLIESALRRAKELAGGEVRPQPGQPAVAPRETDRVDAGPVVAAPPPPRPARTRTVPKVACDRATMEQAGVLLAVDDAAADRAYRILRTRVQHRMQAGGWHSLGVTAAGVGDGKTLTSINMALAMARDVNAWIYLVDLDLTRPKVASYLGMSVRKGLDEFLAGGAEFDEILHDPGVERLTVIPNAVPQKRSSEMLSSPRVRELCAALAAEEPRPIVVFDLPPVLAGDDVLKFAPNLDCTLLVVSEHVTSREVLQQARGVLEEMNLLGVVLNRSAARGETGYYYY